MTGLEKFNAFVEVDGAIALASRVGDRFRQRGAICKGFKEREAREVSSVECSSISILPGRELKLQGESAVAVEASFEAKEKRLS